MVQPRGELDLAQEPVSTERVAQRGVEHLECYTTFVLDVVGEVYRRHSAAAQLSVDCIARRKRSLQLSQSVFCHCCRKVTGCPTSERAAAGSKLMKKGTLSGGCLFSSCPAGCYRL